MIALKKQHINWGAKMRKGLQLLGLAVMFQLCSPAFAQENSIESINAYQQGANVIVKVTLKNPVGKAPIGFSITNPARIALDFANTANATGKNAQSINLGDVRNVNLVQAGERSRLVFNLLRPLNYATAVDGNAVVVTIDGSGGVATAVNSSGAPVSTQTASAATGKPSLRDIDFRRGSGGEGRIVVDLSSSQIGVDVRQQGQKILVDFTKTSLPDTLRRRLDVTDFGTPVQSITTKQQGDNIQMVIDANGLWEHSAYQSDTQLVIEVKPIKEQPNKLVQGSQGYRGEKLSLNFQNVEVRAVLQVIADFTGFNIITSDTVTGNLTLRLKDVPWDQALDIVMQAKGLDMRKNGSVIWIAPRDELLTKEKLELEQKSQISELEPVRTETFQLNYQKADAFKSIFGVDGTSKNSVLSKRGSAVVDPRTNKLIVTDISTKLEEVRKLIAITDVPTRQVLIEARIVEANDKFGRNLGAKLGFGNTGIVDSKTMQVGGSLGATPNTITNSNSVNLPAAPVNGFSAGSLALTLFNAAATRFIGLELTALESDGQGKIVSSPRVVTADQQPALIEQGEEIPVTTPGSGNSPPTTTYKKVNLKLEVTPQITPDGSVILTVDVTKDSRGDVVPGGLAVNTKHVKTNVQVENGG
ncbi:MAG: type IV pilus secretin PilQ, partial [Proteobacteria bacterium]|nr:type IV pilus secretin PilQ [Pseudomonadota bacterium]